MKPTYSKQQIIHSLSFASNSAFKKVFEDTSTCQKSYKKLQAFVKEKSQAIFENKKVQELIGSDWQTVWGPIVYSHDKNSSFARADNTMGMYYSKLQNLFVIAIAGTNSISSYGWFQEDFHVNKTAVWKDISGHGKGSISQGTATGLNILRDTMKDNNKTILTALKDFIISNNIEPAEVAVTGHSLGGALSPALALYLSDKQSEWDVENKMQVSTYPTAGPTIGVYKINSFLSSTKDGFTDYYEEQIRKGKIKYHSIKNSLDIVPLSWNKDDLTTIPNLYKAENIKDVSFGTAALVAVLNTFKKTNKKAQMGKQYVYKQIDGIKTLKGTFHNETNDKVEKVFNSLRWLVKNRKGKFIPESLEPNIDNLENIARFFAQAAYQHTQAYGTLLNINAFLKEFTEILAENSKENKVHNTAKVAFDVVNEAVGVDISALLELSQLSEEEIESMM